MRKTVLLLLCLISASASAIGNADLVVTSFLADKTQIEAGGEITLTIRLKNAGTDSALHANFNLGNSYTGWMNVINATSTEGWTCSPVATNCYSPAFAPGAEAELRLSLATPPTIRPEPLWISFFGSASNESSSANNQAQLELAVAAPSRNADLSVSVDSTIQVVRPGTPIDLVYDVRNNGPQDLNTVRANVYIGSQEGTPVVAGAGWTCATHPSGEATCVRASLASGETAPLAVHFVTNGNSTVSKVEAFTGQAHIDSNLVNDRDAHAVSVGDAADWARVLLPITATDIPGSNGSLWRTDITGLLDGTGSIEPVTCGPIEDPCSFPPVHQAFDARDDLIVDEFGTQFVYLPSAVPQSFTVSTRVHDASKSSETAGAFIPSARDGDFSASGFSLLGVPSSEQFRSMLRIYEYGATEGAVAEVSIYAEGATEPFYLQQHPLLTGTGLLTPALLPLHPGYGQLDLSSILLSSNQGSRFRVTVRPVGDTKMWGFISITNNATSHVTIVTP